MNRYIDISSNNRHPIDFKRVKASGIDGVWIKATEGNNYTNPFCKGDATAARKAGLRVGFYHFARPDKFLAREEAVRFVRVVRDAGGIKRRDLRPALDMEHGTPHSSYTDWCRAWNKIVTDSLGVGPLFYSYSSYINGMHPTVPIGYGLWLADYSSNNGAEHPTSAPWPWKKYVAHQYTSRGTVAGVAGLVDVSNAPVKRRVLAHPLVGLI